MNFEAEVVEAIITAAAANQEYNQQCGGNAIQNSPQPIITRPSSSKGWNFSGHTQKPDNNLSQAVESIIGKSIQAYQFDADTAPNIEGMVLEYKESYAEIFLNKGLNFCWQRFIFAKELCHLLLNKSDNEYRESKDECVRETIDYLTFKTEISNKIQASEITAYIGAIELLLPKHTYEQTLELTNTELASLIRCPVKVIELRRDNKEVVAWFNQAYSNQRYENALINERIKRASK